jgi:hypothetical protein
MGMTTSISPMCSSNDVDEGARCTTTTRPSTRGIATAARTASKAST